MARTPTQTRVIYSDLFLNLDLHPLTDDLALKTNEASVKQRIRNLIMTDMGERKFQPLLGGHVRKMLFENFTAQTVQTAKQRIETLIRENEPAAFLREVNITSFEDENAIAIEIVFTTINTEQPISLELVLQRVR